MLSNILKFFFTLLLPFVLHAESLSLEEQVGQLLIVRFEGIVANAEARKLVKEAHVGGFIYYTWSNGLKNPCKVKYLSKTLQKLSKKIPLWICLDQEGGPVNRLGDGFPKYLGNREIAKKGNPAFAKKQAYTLAKDLLKVGINMNLAPVIDVSIHPERSFIFRRTYGDDPETVAAFAEQALLGYKEAGMLAVLKHFPGCGDVELDPHIGLPFLNKSRAEMEKVELYPFKKCLPVAKGIMTTHLMVPALDPLNCATFSRTITTGILRKEWSYEGLILSDSLVMEGLFAQCSSLEEAAIRALEAGCDLLLFGGKQLEAKLNEGETMPDAIVRIHQAIVEAVRSGRLPLKRIEESVARNLRYKKEFIKGSG
jgi:beta-N-acetylhexosaminidase